MMVFYKISYGNTMQGLDFLLEQLCEKLPEAACQNPVLAPAAAMLLTVGAGAYYYCHRNTGNNNMTADSDKTNEDDHSKLISAINQDNIELAQEYIANMSLEELNKADKDLKTPLYHALHAKKMDIAIALVNRFLEARHSLNTHAPDGKSLFNLPGCTKKLLSLVSKRYTTYACSDISNFSGHINDKLSESKKEEIRSRKSKNIAAENTANMIMPLNGQYTKGQITEAAKHIDKAESAVCTGFALAVADKLLTLFPELKFKLVAHKGSYRSTHVFVVVNCGESDWEIDKLEKKVADQSQNTEEGQSLLEKVAKQSENIFIVDAWLGSLGWKNGTFSFREYLETPDTHAFIEKMKCYFDSTETKNDNKLAIRL